jgi:hypothetical protein
MTEQEYDKLRGMIGSYLTEIRLRNDRAKAANKLSRSGLTHPHAPAKRNDPESPPGSSFLRCRNRSELMQS